MQMNQIAKETSGFIRKEIHLEACLEPDRQLARNETSSWAETLHRVLEALMMGTKDRESRSRC